MKTAPQQQTVTRFVHSFDEAIHGGRELLGGKGLGLSEMAHLDVPVPAGFTITTDACRAYMATGGELPPGLEDEIEEHIARLEHATGSGFGNPINPLLVSVRSGAAISMPGMMDTILDLGLNDETALGPGRGHGERPLRLRLVPPADPDVRRGRRGHRRAPLRAGAHGAQGRMRHPRGRRAGGARSAEADRALPADLRGRGGQAIPARRTRAAAACGLRGLRLVELAARTRVPADLRDLRGARDRRERDADGVREQGRRLRDRRLLQPRPLDRRARHLRRVPDQRSGGGRRRGYPAAPNARRHA